MFDEECRDVGLIPCLRGTGDLKRNQGLNWPGDKHLFRLLLTRLPR